MKKSQLSPLPQYFDRYINKCDDVELIDAIETSIDELDQLPIQQLHNLGDKVYAPEKWTIRDILQHLIDVERIFAYRALCFARGDEQVLPSMDENSYAIAAYANDRSLMGLIEELKISHLSVLAMYRSFSNNMLYHKGRSFSGTYSVADIGFIIPGHQRWHFDIIKEKYLTLL